MGWKRAARYVSMRILRLSAASDAVARGIACGATVSFFPIFGVHAVLAMGLALLVRANVLAAALGTLLFPPVILPLVFSLDFVVGRKILNWAGIAVHVTENGFDRHAAHGVRLLEQFDSYFLPAFTGSVLFMVLVWPAAFMASTKAIGLLRHHHERKKQNRKAAGKAAS